MKIDKSEYGDYYERYIKLSNGTPLTDLFASNFREMRDFLDGLTEEDSQYRYEENKWSLKQVFGHLMDTERIFNYRALCLARGEQEALPGYDHDAYVQNADFNRYLLNNLKEQYESTRNFTLSLFSGFSDEELLRRGTINGHSFTVRATGYVIAGHELHHLNVINERYLPGLFK